MKILIYRWKSYNYTDIIGTLRLMGHEVREIDRRLLSYDEDPGFQEEIGALLDREPVDFLFTVNYFAAISDLCESRRIPYVVWTCDNPLISMYHRSLFNSCNRIFTFDMTNYLELKGMGVERVYHLPLGVDTDRLDFVIASEGTRYEHEISFVGSLYDRNAYDRMEKELPDYLRGYFDAAIEAQLSISGGNILERLLTPEILSKIGELVELKKSEDSFSDLSLIFATTVLGFKTASEQRKRALIELSKRYRVDIYSDSDVEGMTGLKNHGTVDYWNEMPRVFHDSKINLNLTIPDIKSGLPLRIFDVLGSGGFLLTNFQAELPACFTVGKDLVCFESQEELTELCGYYLSHEDERREIARHGYETVKKEHQVRERLDLMLRICSESA